MIVLGIETSGAVGSLALLDEARGLLAEITLASGLRHGQALLPALQAALRGAGLEKGAIDLFAVGTGPGSYTGLRVGIATGKALAYALRKPLAGAPSFDALAQDLPSGALAGAAALVVAADARRDRLYSGRYDPATRARKGEFGVVPAERLFEGIEGPIVLAGAGLERYPDLASRARRVEAHPHARAVARLALAAFRANPAASVHDVKPLYLTPGVAGAEG